MAKHYSAATGGFYDENLHRAIPQDAVDVSDADYNQLLAGQEKGKVISAGPDGRPLLTDPPLPSAAELLAQERARMWCSRFQARAALHMAGLLDAAEQAVAAEGPLVQIAWADADTFRRHSPTILTLGARLGLSEDQIDDLFRTAMMIEA